MQVKDRLCICKLCTVFPFFHGEALWKKSHPHSFFSSLQAGIFFYQRGPPHHILTTTATLPAAPQLRAPVTSMWLIPPDTFVILLGPLRSFTTLSYPFVLSPPFPPLLLLWGLVLCDIQSLPLPLSVTSSVASVPPLSPGFPSNNKMAADFQYCLEAFLSVGIPSALCFSRPHILPGWWAPCPRYNSHLSSSIRSSPCSTPVSPAVYLHVPQTLCAYPKCNQFFPRKTSLFSRFRYSGGRYCVTPICTRQNPKNPPSPQYNQQTQSPTSIVFILGSLIPIHSFQSCFSVQVRWPTCLISIIATGLHFHLSWAASALLPEQRIKNVNHHLIKICLQTGIYPHW